MTIAITVALVLAGVAIFFLLHRSAEDGDTAALDKVSPTALVQVLPGTPACDAVRRIVDERFRKGGAPMLPMPRCSMTKQCTCRLRLAPERRGNRERRSGHDKRDSIRYEPDAVARRQNPGRRSGENPWKGSE
jgi:hypothetical protein